MLGSAETAATSIRAIAATQRRQNALVITLVLTLLGVAVLPPAWLLGARGLVLWAVIVTDVGYAIAFWLVRRRSVTQGVFAAVASLLTQHVAMAAGNVELQPAPYLAAIPVLVAAATLTSRGLWAVFGVTLLAIGIEGSIRTLSHADAVTLLSGSVLAIVAFVVSLLHVRSMERAFSVAAERDTERANATAIAIESEERFRLIADRTDDLFALLDPEGNAVYLSPSHDRIFGRMHADCQNHPLEDFAVPESLADLRRAFQQAMVEGEGRCEADFCGASGASRTFDVKMTRVESKHGPMVAITSRDITERKQYQQRLLVSDRMESLGRLAGTVAHDFNNLLMVIGGATELARNAVKDRKDVVEDLDGVLEATHSASKLTRQLLTFSRKQVVSPVVLDLGESLNKLRELLDRLLGKKITLVYDFAPDCAKVVMAVAHLEQLAMNLSVNARDAMPKGGELRFSLRTVDLDSNAAAPLAAGTYTELSVTDQGDGIPEEIKTSIFEPMFTTKGDAGTGLGLATCQSIAIRWHGSIRVESPVGQGATFRVRFPAATQPSTHDPPRPSPVPEKIRRVLVVDDEPAPRETAARLLRLSGFDVVVASNLEEARQYIADPTLTLDALLTDVVLSGELGTDLLEDCRARRPDTRIVVMSGYSPNPSANAKLIAVSARFLPKPFTRAELRRALQVEPHR